MKKIWEFLKGSKIILGGTLLLSIFVMVMAHIPGDPLIFEIIACFILWINLAFPLLFWKGIIQLILKTIRSARGSKQIERSSITIRSTRSEKKPQVRVWRKSSSERCEDSHVFGDDIPQYSAEPRRYSYETSRFGYHKPEETLAEEPIVEPIITSTEPVIEPASETPAEPVAPVAAESVAPVTAVTEPEPVVEDPEVAAVRREKYKNSPLLDKHIAFLGQFKQNRAELEAMPETVGALLDPVVCETTDFLVLGDTSNFVDASKRPLPGHPEAIQLERARDLYSRTGKPRNISEMDYLSRIESALRWLEI